MNNSASAPPVITAQHLTKVFRDFWHRPKVKAVNGISFEVRRGEVFGLLGPNGSGKSTTIKMILGLLHPTAGTLKVLGHAPRDVKTKQRIGYLPEESYLYPFLTGAETLHFYGRLFDLNRSERKERIRQLLDMIGLKHARNRIVGEFSKGMARRIGLAQALINDPDVVVLDEPTSGLDPLGTRQVKDLIHHLSERGKTVLLCSHLLSDVEDVCDRIAILYNGKIHATGPIRELLAERDRYQINLPELPPETLQAALNSLREILGAEPELDHPRLDLERFFLDVVDRARGGAQEPASGVQREAPVASYLGAASGRDKLEALASPETQAPAPEPSPRPEDTAAPDAEPEAAAESGLSEDQKKAAEERLRKLMAEDDAT